MNRWSVETTKQHMEGFTMTLTYTYSRAQAIADGILVDVSEMAREAGIVYPTALTCAVWERYVRVPSHVPGQDEAGRLWDILWMFRCAARAPRTDRECESIRQFGLFVRNEPGELESVSLKAICGPGDLGEPVLTIALSSED